MKLACVTRVTLAHGIHGGMERHLDELAGGLAQRGHDITVYTTGHPHGRLTETHNGVQYRYLPTPPGKYRRAWWRESRRALRHSDFDLVWAEGSAGEPVARLTARPPMVSILQGTYHGEMLTRRRAGNSPRLLALAALMWWRKHTWKAHIERVQHVIAVSRQIADEAQQTTAVRPPQLTVIPNSIDTDTFRPFDTRPDHLRAAHDIPPTAPLFITVSRLEREKGIHLAIEAVRHTADAHLLIVGRGRDEENLRRQADERVHFAGFVDHADLPTYYNTADAFLAPTLRNEGLPVSIIEAMAAGLPIIGSDMGGIRAAVDHEQTGLLFPTGDVAALTTAVQQFIHHPHDRRRLAAHARRTAVDRYSTATVVAQTESVFRRVIEAHRP